MSVELVFEDKETTPSSVLLRSSGYSTHIHFSGGARKLLDEAVKLRGDNNIVYAFYDLAPNNSKTVNRYNQYVEDIKTNKELYYNIYLVPIICIEFYICKYLLQENLISLPKEETDALYALLPDFDYGLVPKKFKEWKYTADSIEHLFKHFINQHHLRCFHNRFEYNKMGSIRKLTGLSGIFYEKSCSCDIKYCPFKSRLTLQEKAEGLYFLLPVFFLKDDKHKELAVSLGLTCYDIDLVELQSERQSFYDDVCESLGVVRVRIHIMRKE